MSRPIPVPSECFDMTPPDLWSVYWEEYPEGTELPATVPKGTWEKEWERRNETLALTAKAPPPPPLWKSYWGKLRGNALSSRKRKPDPEEALPPVYPPRLSRRFWQRYFELFPDGHGAPGYEPQGPAQDYQEQPPTYKLVRGSLHVFDRGVWRPSTGVDALDPSGNWVGAG